MFRRSVLCFNRLCLVWLFISGVVRGQGATHLKLQPERLRQNQVAEQQARLANDSLALAEAYYQYGRTYVFAGDYQTSQGYFLKALRILEPRGSSEALSRIYVRLSENEDRLGRLPDAVRYARLALTIARRTDSVRPLGRAYGVMARMYEHMWLKHLPGSRITYDSVLYYHRSQTAVYRTLNDTLGILESNLELGTLMTKAHDPHAMRHLNEALRLVNRLGRDRVKVNVLLHTAEAYRTFGKLQLALQTLQAADTLYKANQEDIYDNILGIEQEYVRYYRTVGQWQQAFEHQARVNELVTNQLLSDRDGKIAQLNVAYETEKKEALLKARNRELTLSAQTIQTQQRFTLATSALFVVTAGMSVVFFRLYRKNQRISRRNETLVREQNHRVKNNLQVISSLLNLQSKRLSDEVARKAVAESLLRVQSMAIVHRRLYDGDQLAEVNLNEFIQELVESVLKTYGQYAVETSFDIDAISLSADKAVPLGLILNELATNACKYAFPRSANPRFSVVCYRRHTHLKFTVTDNGPGLDGSPMGSHSPESGSFGMQLIQAQVRQLRGISEFRSDGGSIFTLEFTI